MGGCVRYKPGVNPQRRITLKRCAIVWIASHLVAVQAILAAFLSVQPLVAAQASASEAAFVICHGAGEGAPDRHAPAGAAGLHCALCVFAAAYAIAPHEAMLAGHVSFSTPVIHTDAFSLERRASDVRAGLSRAPPQYA
jgi:hypothetical protein